MCKVLIRKHNLYNFLKSNNPTREPGFQSALLQSTTAKISAKKQFKTKELLPYCGFFTCGKLKPNLSFDSKALLRVCIDEMKWLFTCGVRRLGKNKSCFFIKDG